jgi:hypothetical protein
MHDWEVVTSKRFACYFPLGGFIGGAKGETARTVKRGYRNARMMGVLRRKALIHESCAKGTLVH